MVENRKSRFKALSLTLVKTTDPAEILAVIATLKPAEIRLLANELRGIDPTSQAVADGLITYYDATDRGFIATNLIQAVCRHGGYRHLDFMLKVISSLAPRSRSRHDSYAIQSAIRGAGYLGLPDDVNRLLNAAIPWAPKSNHAERCLGNELARSITLMLVKRDGLGVGDLDGEYYHRIQSYSGPYGMGPPAMVEEAKRIVLEVIGPDTDIGDSIIRRLEGVFLVAERSGVLLGMSYGPSYARVPRSIRFARFEDKLRENPSIRFCETCGVRMPYITAYVFSTLGRCPRCLFIGFRCWLVDVVGLSPKLWQYPPKNSPVGCEKSSVGASFSPRQQWQEGTIRSYDQAMQRVRDFGPSMSFWHGLMGKHTGNDQPYSLKIRGDNGHVVAALSKSQKHAGGLVPRFLFTLWQGEVALMHEREAAWVNEEATLNIVSDILGEHALREWTADWLVNPATGANLYVDGYFPRHSIGVEHQGRQHYEPLDFFGGEEAFTQLQQRDRVKCLLLEQHKIKALYIRYDEVNRKAIAAKVSQLLASCGKLEQV